MSQQMHLPPQPGQFPQQPAPAAPARNGLGTAALILGLIGAVFAIIPFMFWLGGILGLIALILGLAGLGRTKRGEATNKGVTLSGAILGLLSVILSVVVGIATVTAVNDVVDDLNKGSTATSGKDKSSGDSGKDGGKEGSGKGGSEKAEVLAAGDSAVYDDELWVTVNEPEAYKPSEWAAGHTKGNNAYKVTVVVENKGKEKFDTALLTVDGRAGKDGVEAEQIIDDGVEGLFTGSVAPGKKVSVVFAFDTPADAKNLDVEVSPGLTYDSSSWGLKL